MIQPLPTNDYLPTWYAQRSGGALGPLEQAAANKAAAHANTPAVSYVDSLGRSFLTVADNGADGKFESRIDLDIEGLQRSVGDALGRTIMVSDYDMLGNAVHHASMEAAERWMLNDAAGKPIRSWDARGHNFRSSFDARRRLTGLYVLGTDATHSDPRTTAAEVQVSKNIYGEGQPNDTALNLRGHTFQQFDNAGLKTIVAYDFKGNALNGTSQLALDYKGLADWSGSPPMQPQIFTTAAVYDALNRPIAATSPDGSILRRGYNAANLLDTVTVNLQGSTVATGFVTHIEYDAKGQRTLIQFQSGASTAYTYDTLTQRLVRLTTTRPGTVQDLLYTFDPVGNITHIQDNAQDTVFFKNRRVEPSNDFTYDPIYRLILATGREQLGQSATGLFPAPTSYNDAGRVQLLQPGDGNAMGTYTEQYLYDAVGNFTQFIHQGSDPANPGWKRAYTYSEVSLLGTGQFSNRLSQSAVSGAQPLNETYGYDLHGNMLRMPQLQMMQWDYSDHFQVAQRQAVNAADTDGVQHQGERTFFVYDSTGLRMRKVTQRANGTLMKERLYLGGYEVYREYDGTGTTLTLERQSLHVMDDSRRIALVETRTQGTDAADAQLIRYQFGNHLRSASLELDETAQIISYEEYYPYGGTSYQAGRTVVEVSLKRYRFTGMERDEESGLNYQGARYYASWLGRWSSADPIFLLGGINLYEYGASNPVGHVDPEGHAPKKYEKQRGKDTAAKQREMQHNINASKNKGYSPDPMQKRAENIGLKRGKTPIEHHHHSGVKQAGQVKLDPKQMGEHMSSVWSTKKDPTAKTPVVKGEINGKAMTHHNIAKHLDLDEQDKGPRTAAGLRDAAKAAKARLPATADMTERAKMDWTRSDADPSAAKVKPFAENPSAATAVAEQQMRARNAQTAEVTGSAKLTGFEEMSGAQMTLRSGASIAGRLMSVAEPFMWYQFFRDYYHSQTTTQVNVGWTTGHELWIPSAMADGLLNANILKNGDYFVSTMNDDGAELWQIRDGKPVNTGYIYDSDQNAFIRHHDEDEVI